MNTVNFIKHFSAKTWSDIRFARNKAGVVRLGEVTVTQTLILSIAYYYQSIFKSAYLFEARDEKANGNDIELFIINSNGKLVAYPCQAKIVDKKPNEIYSQLNHSNKSNNLQIDALIAYGNRLQGFPLYLFYNYSNDTLFRNNLVNEVADFYGCSYVPATYLKYHYCQGNVWQTPLPSFKDLHPSIGKPFYHLFEISTAEPGLVDINPDPGNFINWQIKEYELDELRSDRNWIAIDYNQDFADLGRNTNLSTSINRQSLFSDVPSVFSPKYRLVFTEL